MKAICRSMTNDRESAEIEKIVKSLTNRLVKVAFDHGIAINDFLLTYLGYIARNGLQMTYKVYKNIINNDQKRIDTLLLTEVANPVNKAICFAFKKKYGTRVIGFEHGNTFGNFRAKIFAVNEMAQL